MHFLPCYTKVWHYWSEEGYFKALSLLMCVSVRSAERNTKWGRCNVNCLWGTDRWHCRSDTVEAAGKFVKLMPQPLSVKHKLIKAFFILLWLESTPDPSYFPGFMLSEFSVHLETVAGWLVVLLITATLFLRLLGQTNSFCSRLTIALSCDKVWKCSVQMHDSKVVGGILLSGF